MIDIKQNVELAEYNTFKIGGEAEYFVVVKNESEVTEALQYAKDNQLAVHVLGGGSNLLVPDEGVKGLVIKNELVDLVVEDIGEKVAVRAAAGMSWDDLVADVTGRELWGLENLSGIPGTVGGAVVQNINAYGVTIADLVFEITAIHKDSGQLRQFTATECNFAYRNSFFKQAGPGKDYVVVGVTLHLSKTPLLQAEYRSSSQSIAAYLSEHQVDTPVPGDIREAILSIRANIGMLEGMYQSAGSFFKNPIVSKEAFTELSERIKNKYSEVEAKFTPWHWSLDNGTEKISAAFLMECTPFNKSAFADGSHSGTVGISPLHTLSIINLGGATAGDVRSFVSEITDTVRNEFDINLESEVCFW